MTELVVLCGTERDGTERAIARMRQLDPDVVVLHHDLRDLGRGLVHRRLRDGGRDEHSVLELDHGCVSCTIRADVLPTLAALAGAVPRVVLHLDPCLEPEPVCWALGAVLVDPGRGRAPCPATDLVDLRGVVTVLDPQTWLDDATGDVTLPERGLTTLPDDERTIAQLAVGQVEFADVLVTTRPAGPRPDPTVAVLDRLAPTAPRLDVDDADERVFCTRLAPGARRGVPGGVHEPLLRGAPSLDADAGVRTLVFSQRRPFHPDRLHDAIDTLLDGVVRARGRVWLATRPDAVLWLESAGGGLRIAHAGEWLDGAGPQAWDAAGADRQALAALAWHPRWGDRAQDLVVLCHAADPDEIDAALRGALLTDAEVAAGQDAWSGLPDPFGWAHDEPCSDPEPAHTDPGTGDGREGGS
ncbi:ribosome hibernation factor-recruiting GTPase MRF [Pseudonocardia sp. HH130630-07]|uniref:ribosome hibernation factor-recruiting GTPase MRF n=1 Tax=Pseudonocardia sp. HH130630-07 TaxID=1690815 RepID=UPI000814CB7C|nr:GTP-binding protein [Pseudonocardia sp. HH130630-07]ANY07358.1 cobalamin biosynthesis protein CobW [Pseudonocardia sp. HH130630-07]